MINLNPWGDDYFNRLRKNQHCCMAGGVGNSRQEAIQRKIKQLAEKLKRLKDQLSMAKTPTEKNSIQIRIEQTQAEIAILERELNT